MPNKFYINNQFNFKQFILAWEHRMSKIFLFQAIQFIQTVLIQPIQFRFSLHTVKCHNSSILNNSVLRKYSFNVKNSSISKNSV